MDKQQKHQKHHQQKKTKHPYLLLIMGILVIGWIGLIFYFSSQPPNASNRQSRGAVDVFYMLDDHLDFTDTVIYEKAVDFFKNVILKGQYETSNALIRKSAHVGIYLVLGFMVTLLAYYYHRRYHLAFILGISLPTLIAVMDEYRQSFIGRTSSLDDVVLDGFGATVGTIICLLILMLIKFILYLSKKHRHT
ncbi:VanZ family protein [Petrocella sp. FN5]|uniref:VanZ family protein n=1 Tax=Petrocella sp. FN5 TaxID=3032002 RepID=UPI0023D98F07|nr:VanZ family protein [Petrocella sp. FN5]MDF1617770.1 VanZ family protein [Petrocella sp. FN5]